MVVNALLVQCVNSKPGDSRIIPQSKSDIAHHVFDKHWIVERLHRHVSFIRAFQSKPPLDAMLAAMPVKVILNADAGLLGAAVFAAAHP